MLTITIADSRAGTERTATTPTLNGPSLRSAIEEIRNEVGERLVGPHKFAKEAALTRAAAGLAALASAINGVFPEGDEDYA